jgi:hypothetical protein
MRTRSRLFDIAYYSQIQLSLIAACLTVVVSAVTLQTVVWASVGIVGLGTYIIYSIDNLVDWREDRTRYPSLDRLNVPYRIWCALTVPLAILGIVGMLPGAKGSFAGLLSALGGVALAVATFRLIQPEIQDIRRLRDILPNRLLVSMFWAINCVFLPGWYVDLPLTTKTWVTFAFVWQLSFITAVLWSLEFLSTPDMPLESLTVAGISANRIIAVLIVISASSATLAIVDILWGYFPPYNVVVICAPILNWIALSTWSRWHGRLRLFNTVLTFGQMLCAALITAVHLAIV